jgi:hypothetical protein
MANSRTLLTLLFSVSIVAALAIGVAATLWFTRGAPQPAPSAQSPGMPATGGASPGAPAAPTQASAPSGAASPAQPAAAAVFVNQVAVTQEQLDELKQAYGAVPPAGRYWYDPRSGLYGVWGHEAAGYIKPGHSFASLPANASNGSTGVFINGREINLTEAAFFQRIFGAVYQGRWWLDGTTGNVGQEGNPMPLANIVVALQQAQRSAGGGGGGYRWRDNITNSSGGAEGGCVWLNMPGSSYSSSGCG